MKRKVYILMFTILGGLLGFFLHMVVEILYINALLSDYQTFGLGLSFAAWFTIHDIVTVLLFVAGLAWGFFAGKKYWRILYVEQRFRRWIKKPLKQDF